TQYNAAGDPYGIWRDATTGPYPTDADTDPDDIAGHAPGVKAASSTAQNSLFNNMQPTPEGVSAYGDRIYIRAEYININGLLQSGRADYDLVIGDAAKTLIQNLENANATGKHYLAAASNDQFSVYWDADLNRIILDEMRVSGGFIELEGRILNTGKGEI